MIGTPNAHVRVLGTEMLRRRPTQVVRPVRQALEGAERLSVGLALLSQHVDHHGHDEGGAAIARGDAVQDILEVEHRRVLKYLGPVVGRDRLPPGRVACGTAERAALACRDGDSIVSTVSRKPLFCRHSSFTEKPMSGRDSSSSHSSSPITILCCGSRPPPPAPTDDAGVCVPFKSVMPVLSSSRWSRYRPIHEASSNSIRAPHARCDMVGGARGLFHRRSVVVLERRLCDNGAENDPGEEADDHEHK
jgi:hypothetical protein